MKKIGILGGTFNPPHIGHLIIANEVLNQLALDEIWFMPNQEPPHKQAPSNVTSEDRLEMVKRAVKGNPKFKVETIELNRTGRSYTFDTMHQLNALYPDFLFYFIIGADMIEYLPKWHRIDDLLKLVSFVGLKRPSYSEKTKYPVIQVEAPSIDLSSSLLRNRIMEGKSTQYLIPEEVRLYIEENQLYGS